MIITKGPVCPNAGNFWMGNARWNQNVRQSIAKQLKWLSDSMKDCSEEKKKKPPQAQGSKGLKKGS